MEGVVVFGIESKLCVQYSMNIYMYVCQYVCMYYVRMYVYAYVTESCYRFANKVLQN